MNKLRVIDLLNMISKGEEVPNKIKYRNKIFIYDKDNLCYVVGNYNEYGDLLVWLSNHKGTDLNYEVEVIEEDKKIDKIHKIVPSANYIIADKSRNIEDRLEIIRKRLYDDELYMLDISNSINEIIDKINKE